MEGYEKIKTVGKGSFGTATLYKRLDDGILVVMKEVFLSDMTQPERKFALNEVQVLSALNHENIIRYLGSFERDGSLFIVMEYANGGNLAQLINLKIERNETFSELAILNIFMQISAGISYMHQHKILHRDMKSANIFLNKNGTIKIGDFGISKMMDTRSQAQTVVGTPYYLSPEMCEGKEYNEKSDIWSMGCILYELICLRKPFDATSLPGLVRKITSCDYLPIPESYTDGLYRLIEMILQRDVDKRPTADYLHERIIPALLANLNDVVNVTKRFSLSFLFNKTIPKDRSILYELYGFTDAPDLYPVQLPHKRIIDFSNSETHFLVITNDKRVYSWGEDSYGQLGHGYEKEFRKYPTCIDALRGKNIQRCCAGDGYSIFLTENGNLYSCGDGKYGCLGHGDWDRIAKPQLIETLISVHITEISAGSRHVIALGSNGKVYAWGSAQEGQLGLGHTQYCCKPMIVKVTTELNIYKVYAGFNTSALLTSNGRILFAGSNKSNKLGFDNLSYLKTFIMLDSINYKIKEVSLGMTHTVLLLSDGYVLCMGNNEYGQCGVGKMLSGTPMIKVDFLNNIEKISAGTSYTIVGSNDNVIYFWGTYYKKVSSGNNEMLSENVGTMTEIEARFKQLKYQLTPESYSLTPTLEANPVPILALYASKENIKADNIVWLEGLSANDNSISVLVHTTAPPPMQIFEEEHDARSKILDHNWTSENAASNRNVLLPNTPETVYN